MTELFKSQNLNLNQCIARYFLTFFDFEDLKSPELKVAVDYWTSKL
jgi:hypothetical protein